MHPVTFIRHLVKLSDDPFGIQIFNDRHPDASHGPSDGVIRNELGLTVAKVADCARFFPEFAFSGAVYSKRASMALSSALSGTCLEPCYWSDFGGK